MSKEKILNWYQKETEKDNEEIERLKKEFINKIKKVDKNQMFDNPKKEKLNIWQRIKKVLMGI